MALSAWNIQKLSGGRFTLGLGSQVKGHVQRRYGVAWAPPAPRMREYVQAIRAVWDCWQNDVPLRFHGEHYKLDLMVPLFNPGPIDDPHIPIHLAAVNSVMCRVAGEVADGLRPHPVCTPSYIEECMIPQVRAGAEKSDRSLEAFSIAVKPLVATASDAEGLRAETESTRAKIAFYASTPGYFAAFEHHGLADFADEAGKLSKERRWDEMAALVDDDILHRFAVVGTYAEIGKELVHRFGQLATHCEFSIPARTAAERDALAALLAEVRAAGAR
jgi:probable F420-dependent oxidoreductase